MEDQLLIFIVKTLETKYKNYKQRYKLEIYMYVIRAYVVTEGLFNMGASNEDIVTEITRKMRSEAYGLRIEHIHTDILRV